MRASLTIGAFLILATLQGCAGRSTASDAQMGAANAVVGGPPIAAAAQSGEERTFRIVPQQTTVSYEAQEKWLNWPVPTKAIAKTNDVEGEFTLVMGNQPRLAGSRFRVDMRTLVSEPAETPMSRFTTPPPLILSVRDGLVRTRLQSAEFPFAEFTATSLDGLPPLYVLGQAVNLNAAGELTIRDVTRPAVFETEATLSVDSVSGKATTHILMTDFGVQPPGPEIPPGTTTVEDALDIVIRFTAKASPAEAPLIASENGNPKLASELAALVQLTQERGTDEALRAAREQGYYVADGNLRVIVEGARGASTGAVRAIIVDSGGQVEDGYIGITNRFQVLLPVAAMVDLAANPQVGGIRATFRESGAASER